jgi:hypothetical protein
VSSTASTHGRRRTVLTVCPTCRGEGQVARSQTIEVTIPKGLKDGSRIRLAGLGGRGVQGGKPGDLYLRVRLLPHRLFRADGYDLSAQLPVWDDEAALGAEIAVPTLSGTVVVRVPPQTQTGRRLRLKGKGLPKSAGEGAGDLYWDVVIMGPDELAPKERDLYEALRRLRTERGGRDAIRRRSLPDARPPCGASRRSRILDTDMLTLNRIRKAYGGRVLFDGASLHVGARERVALVGPNGAGKTTLFEMLAGRLSPDDGDVLVQKGVVIGYLPQEINELKGRTILQEVLSVSAAVNGIEHRMTVLQAEMAGAADDEPGAPVRVWRAPAPIEARAYNVETRPAQFWAAGVPPRTSIGPPIICRAAG